MAELRPARALQSGILLHCGMARARRRPARTAGPRNPADVRGERTHRCASRVLGAGRSLARRGLVALALFLGASCALAQVVSTRIWPARDYTRVTLETKGEVKFQLFSVKDPERLVLDPEVAELGPALTDLHGRVATG